MRNSGQGNVVHELGIGFRVGIVEADEDEQARPNLGDCASFDLKVCYVAPVRCRLRKRSVRE